MPLADEKKNRLIYQTAVEGFRLAVWEYNIKEKTVKFTDNGYTSSYYKDFYFPEIIAGVPRSVESYFEDSSIASYRAMYEAIDSGESKAECTVRYRRDGPMKGRYEHIIMIAEKDGKGQSDCAIGISQDITEIINERNRFDDMNTMFESKMHSALSSARLDLSSDSFISVRSIFPSVEERQKSEKASEFLSKVADDIVDDEIKNEFFKKFNISVLLERFKDGMKQFSIDYPVLGFEGEYKWIHSNLSMSQNPETGHVEAVTWAEDVTGTKNMQLILDRMVTAAMSYVGIISIRTGKLTILSNSAEDEKMPVGRSLSYAEMVKTRAKEVVVKEEREFYEKCVNLDRIESALNESDDYKIPYSAVVNGVQRRLQAHFLYLNRKFGQIMMMITDITDSYAQDRKRIQVMEDALLEVEKANIARLDFIARISHDIRTPMGIISNMSDFALNDIDDRTKLTEDLKKIKSANTFLMSLINDVLDVSNFENERVKLQSEPYYINDFINEIESVFETVCEQKDISFTIVHNGPAVAVLCDKIRFRQVALNLLNNAVNFTRRGGKITFVLAVSLLPENKAKLDISVTDTGIGMSEEFAKTMFRPFSQEVDNPYRAKNAAGAGLGLYIVKNIINLMEGTIDVKTKLGEGTQISCSIEVPVIDSGSEADKDKQSKEPDKDSNNEEADKKLSGTVLLVDDNEINREIAIRILNSLGLEADEAENGEFAVQKMKKSGAGAYIAVLMDIQMPVMNGYEATSAIRKLGGDEYETIPIIALTANAFKDAADKAKDCGMNDIITKPLQPDVLISVLKRFVGQGIRGWMHESPVE
ncbi:MAG: response regulator [Treponema sp.]|nr:response regulator [Treponema sp.]